VLGHAQLETMAHYAQANLQPKRDALARNHRSVSVETRRECARVA
jgi:hypothetical protein